jgi:hypothetical protein
MRASAKGQRLDALEREFESLLILCLKECANGRWGLFGQNQHPDSIRALRWSEADRLKELAEQIAQIRTEFGQLNPNCERFLEYRAQRGENLLGEPQRAKKFLRILGVEW